MPSTLLIIESLITLSLISLLSNSIEPLVTIDPNFSLPSPT